MAKAKISLNDVVVKGTDKTKGKNPVIAAEGDLASAIVEYNQIQQDLKVLKARQDSLGPVIREQAQAVWTERALEGKTENLKFVAGDEGELSYIVMDSYAKISESALESIEAAGLERYVERDQIQLVSDLSEETQTRILEALVKEFGKEKALELVQTQYKVRKGSLLDVVAQGSRKLVTAAFELLRPTTQLR